MNIYTGLLFQQGYIGNADLARSLAGGPADLPADDAPRPSTTNDPSLARADTRAATPAATSARLARCRKLLAGQRLAKAARHATALSLFR